MLINLRPAGIEASPDPETIEPVLIPWRWLRDHGEDEASRDPHTWQRRVDTFSIEPGCRGTLKQQAGELTVVWDDGIETTHSWQQLTTVINEFAATDWSPRPEPRPRIPHDIDLWPRPPIGLSEQSLGAFLSSDDELAAGVEQLHRYGYLVLRGDLSTVDRAQAFADRLGSVRHTIFGGLWDLAPDLSEHADTAYDRVFLGPHTDGTYSHDAPGLQFFLCRQAAATGGESLLVDGFAIAAELAAGDPEAFATLASVTVHSRYIEPGVHLAAARPVLRSNVRGELDQVSFNNYDRAPFLLPSELEDRFYRAYGRFAALANDPSRQAAVTLTPGDLMVFDNWRTLHGRNAFEGPRHYCGAYLNHEDLESKRLVLGLTGKDTIHASPR